jgi:hypothetical protein
MDAKTLTNSIVQALFAGAFDSAAECKGQGSRLRVC